MSTAKLTPLILYYPSLRGSISSAAVQSPLWTVGSIPEAVGFGSGPAASFIRTMDASVIGHGLCVHFGSTGQAGES